MHKLPVKVGGLELSSPGMLASGILDENGYTMKRILDEGAGAVVTKSIGMEERNGYMPPVVFEGKNWLLNAMGLPNPGIDHFEDEIAIAKQSGKPVIGSIFGSSVDDFLVLGQKMESFGVSAVELNLSCPHVRGYGSEVGSDPVLVKNIVKELKGTLSIPVWSKLSPNVTSILDIARSASDSDALVLINTLRGMAINIYNRMPVLTNVYGGVSGNSIKPVGLRLVYEVRKEMDIDIIGVGGIGNHEDALEYIMAGANAFQIGTALMHHGRKIFDEVSTGIEEFMAQNGVSQLSELVGCAVQ